MIRIGNNNDRDSFGVFFGNGDGSFKPVQEIPGSTSFRSAEVGDFNNDSHLGTFAFFSSKLILFFILFCRRRSHILLL